MLAESYLEELGQWHRLHIRRLTQVEAEILRLGEIVQECFFSDDDDEDDDDGGDDSDPSPLDPSDMSTNFSPRFSLN